MGKAHNPMSDKLPISLINYLDNRFNRIEKMMQENHVDHEKRISTIEKRNANQDGKVSMAGAIGTGIGGLIVALIGYFK
jgi:hypothetical protein